MNIHQQTQIIELGVNLDRIIGLRNASGIADPNLIQAALVAEQSGADCIILSLDQARENISKEELIQLRSQLITGLRLELLPCKDLIELAEVVKPHQVSFKSGSIDLVGHLIDHLSKLGISSIVTIEVNPSQVEVAKNAGAIGVNINTSRYASITDEQEKLGELRNIEGLVSYALSLGLRVCAGKGLNYTNVQAIAAIPGISELHIGHSIVARAFFVGWARAISEMKSLMVMARLGKS